MNFKVQISAILAIIIIGKALDIKLGLLNNLELTINHHLGHTILII